MSRSATGAGRDTVSPVVDKVARVRWTRTARLWPLVVLPLLAGLFAMHGVQAANGGGDHAMPMVSSASMPYGPSAAGPGHAMPAHPVAAAPAERAAPAMTGHDGAMCLAMLVLTLLALAMTRAPWLANVRGAPRAVRLPRAEYRRPSRGPPVYLRLCVFRL